MREEILDEAYETIQNGLVAAGLDLLVGGLREIRMGSEKGEWESFVQSMCLTHPVRALVHSDPLTWRAFSKPRGYAGDAETLDLIYWGSEALDEETQAIGREVFRHFSSRPAIRAVRNRRIALACELDAAASRTPGSRILSVACGHIREAELSGRLKRGDIGVLYALDQDVESLEMVRRSYGDLAVSTLAGSVRDILRGRVELSDLDLVYSAGLYDYLNEEVGQALTERLFAMLKPGGELLIANFLPAIPDIGYMESFMAWNLIYRTESEMLSLLARIPRSELAFTEIQTDGTENIVWLRAARR